MVQLGIKSQTQNQERNIIYNLQTQNMYFLL